MSAALSTAAGVSAPAISSNATSTLAGWDAYLWILLRQFRFQIVTWLAPLQLLIGVTALSYESVYPSLATRTALIEQIRKSPGTRLLYGHAPLPDRLGQLLQWETGTFLLVCTALMVILLTCRVLRADENEGLVEVLRATGAGRSVSPLVPVAPVWMVVGVLSTGVGGLLSWQTGNIEEPTVSGVWALAGTICVTGWAFLIITAVACQLGRQVGQAKGLSMLVLALALAMRVNADQISDSTDSNRLRWLIPLGWHDLVHPYTDDRFAVFLACCAIAIALVLSAAVFAARCEHLDGYLPDRSSSRRWWRVWGHTDLLGRLSWWSLIGWALASTALALLYGSVSRSIKDLLAPGSPTAFWAAKMAVGSPVKQFMSLMMMVTMLPVVVAAVRRVNGMAGLERAGLVEVELAIGMSHGRVLLSQVLCVLIKSIVLLLVSATALVAATATQLTDDHAVARSFVFTVSQLPGMVVVIGITTALVDLAPKLVGLSWAAVTWSAFAQFFGGLVELKDWAKGLSVLDHHLDVVETPDWKPLAVQAPVGLTSIMIGLVAYTRRDLPA